MHRRQTGYRSRERLIATLLFEEIPAAVASLTIQGELSDDLTRHSAGPIGRSFANLEEDLKAGKMRQNELSWLTQSQVRAADGKRVLAGFHSEEHPVVGCFQGGIHRLFCSSAGQRGHQRIRCSQPHF
jgi:hypothetical protein